jgi:hypothetical protein
MFLNIEFSKSPIHPILARVIYIHISWGGVRLSPFGTSPLFGIRYQPRMREGESVSRSQMDINCKTCDIRTWKNIYFPTCPLPTLIRLSHRFTTASKPATHKSFDCCLSHFRISVSVTSSSAKRFPLSFEQETFLYEYPLQWVLLHTKKRTTGRCSSVLHSSSTVAILTTETSIWTCACASAT